MVKPLLDTFMKGIRGPTHRRTFSPSSQVKNENRGLANMLREMLIPVEARSGLSDSAGVLDT